MRDASLTALVLRIRLDAEFNNSEASLPIYCAWADTLLSSIRALRFVGISVTLEPVKTTEAKKTARRWCVKTGEDHTRDLPFYQGLQVQESLPNLSEESARTLLSKFEALVCDSPLANDLVSVVVFSVIVTVLHCFSRSWVIINGHHFLFHSSFTLLLMFMHVKTEVANSPRSFAWHDCDC